MDKKDFLNVIKKTSTVEGLYDLIADNKDKLTITDKFKWGYIKLSKSLAIKYLGETIGANNELIRDVNGVEYNFWHIDTEYKLFINLINENVPGDINVIKSKKDKYIEVTKYSNLDMYNTLKDKRESVYFKDDTLNLDINIRQASKELKGSFKDDFIDSLIEGLMSGVEVGGYTIDYSIAVDDDLEYNYRINIKF